MNNEPYGWVKNGEYVLYIEKPDSVFNYIPLYTQDQLEEARKLGMQQERAMWNLSASTQEIMDTHPVKELTDRIAELENALQSIDIYLSDTLSGRAEPDPSTYKQWLIDGVIEGRNRARAILRKAQEK